MLIFFVSPACHSSCASCWGPSVSQCTLCPGGLLLHQGQCVEACGEGLYAQDYTCHSESLNTLIKYPVKKNFSSLSPECNCLSVMLSVLAPRLSSLLPFLCGTPGLRLPPLPQTGGSSSSAIESPSAQRLHSWVSHAQLPG